jgi:hypothetical protein
VIEVKDMACRSDRPGRVLPLVCEVRCWRLSVSWKIPIGLIRIDPARSGVVASDMTLTMRKCPFGRANCLARYRILILLRAQRVASLVHGGAGGGGGGYRSIRSGCSLQSTIARLR